MAAQHPSYEAESVEESPMMPAACGQPGEGTLATDDMLKAGCQDSIPRSPNTDTYNSEETAPEPLLAMKKKAAIACVPHQNAGRTAIASSASTSETQAAAAVPPRRPGHEVNDGVTSRKEPGSVKATGPLAAEPSDHQTEGGDENSLGEQHQDHNGPQATQAVVMRRDFARPSASLPAAAEPGDDQTEGQDENGLGEQHQEHNGPQAVVMRHDLATPSASLPAAAEPGDDQTEGRDENGFREQHQEHHGPQAVVMRRDLTTPSASLPAAAEPSNHPTEGCHENGLGEQHQEHNGPQAVVMRRDLATPSASLPAAAEPSDHPTEGREDRDHAEPHEEVNRSHSQVLEAAARLPNSSRSLSRRFPRLQREQSHGRHGGDGPVIVHDGVDLVVNLRRARELDGQWRTSNRVCWERDPPVTAEPCGHHMVCPRCFHRPYPGGANSLCPVCCQPIEGYKFNQDMLKMLVRRSSKK